MDAPLRAWSPPPAFGLRRSLGTIWRQRARSLRCPEGARLDGKLALVTGGNAGIGLETSRGLLRRGAEVIVASRREAKLGEGARWLPLDLADLASVRTAADRLVRESGGRPLDVLIENAGLWPERFAVSPQGHEIAFATNVLGHFALRRALEVRELLPAARVVIVTGDIYAGARACTPDFTYRGRVGGAAAYRRAKLGNLWLARELARRRPALHVVAVHPGVVASDLVRGFGALKRRLFIDCEAGAQASLVAAVHPGIASGSYLHNTGGLVRLAPGDPALDAAGAAALWDVCEAAARPYL
jgi:NAD(P)-dependent dehydrogenase (short-subunit alcohol dehydrogenase family)